MLEVRGIDIAYGAFEVLHQVDLAVGERRILGLFGHNGAGKSSLLKGIYGLLPVRTGTVTFAGERTTNDPPFRQAVRGMRLVPQEGNVFPHMTVEDNLRLGALRLAGDAAIHAARFEDVYGTFPILRERRRHHQSRERGQSQGRSRFHDRHNRYRRTPTPIPTISCQPGLNSATDRSWV